MDPTIYRTYLEKTPGDRFAMYSLALALKKSGDIAGAEQAFRDLLSLHPLSGAGHYQHGLLLHEADRDDDATAAWRRGLDALSGANDPDARRSRSEIQGALDELED
jgi:tetratricopeptide (TPR) repeat protein